MHSHRRDIRTCPKGHHKAAAVPCMVGAFRALATSNAEQLASSLPVSSTCLVAGHPETITRLTVSKLSGGRVCRSPAFPSGDTPEAFL